MHPNITDGALAHQILDCDEQIAKHAAQSVKNVLLFELWKVSSLYRDVRLAKVAPGLPKYNLF